MRTVAFIPARGGSKGIPGKNIKDIAGKPLIVWSIERAKNSKLVDKVIVSTDSEEIAKIAKENGAEVPFLRPEDISGDTATTESAMLHYCDWLEKNNELYDNLLLVQVTSPIRAETRFDDAINYFKNNQLDSLLSVCPSHRFFWRDLENPVASYDFKNRPRRQDLKQSEIPYMETGSFYITKIEKLRKHKNRLCGKVGMFVTPEEESYEIDSLVDFKFCESMLTNSIGTK
ncbi:cytidylyltransferase domain-containing protein [Marinomonas balearica]|uniref:CMP-N-acetylneuraminic acid synthetase n=1 Tax=Marinomonas balearica TaxID=491947 RepID=A0A4R6M455_9GAMM|nr:acylneuraminate cytidylyltransferase family protein [Marinomonas balearica]TDO95984.1 CMP-N-acetylneuraminic acid synthetase [Marinomonas balearica]